MTPLEIVIPMFGNARRLAKALEVHPATIVGWAKPRKRQGKAGDIPSHHHRRLLELAKERGQWLTLEDLCFGRPDFPPAKSVETVATSDA